MLIVMISREIIIYLCDADSQESSQSPGRLSVIPLYNFVGYNGVHIG